MSDSPEQTVLLTRLASLTNGHELATYLRAAFPSPIDSTIQELVAVAGPLDRVERVKIGKELTRAQSDALCLFARRAAQEAVRRREAGLVSAGLAALVLQTDPIDARDVWIEVAPLYRAAELLGLEVMKVFAEAAKLADSEVSAFIEVFPGRSAENRSLGAFRFREEGTGAFFQFVRTAPSITDPGVADLVGLDRRGQGDRSTSG